MEYNYYKCDKNSKAGRRIQRLWNDALRVAQRADAYAKKYGAVSYIQPMEYFEGGVDYLEFEREPDPEVWRLRLVDKDGVKEYEPNCDCIKSIACCPDPNLIPSDTWDRTYSKQRLQWNDVRHLRPMSEWARQCGYMPTDDAAADLLEISRRMGGYSFIPYVKFFRGKLDNRERSTKQSIRKAIRAEKDRQALPVVEMAAVAATLDMDLPKDGKDFYSPTLLLLGENFVISSQLPCHLEGLRTISKRQYEFLRNTYAREGR